MLASYLTVDQRFVPKAAGDICKYVWSVMAYRVALTVATPPFGEWDSRENHDVPPEEDQKQAGGAPELAPGLDGSILKHEARHILRVR